MAYKYGSIEIEGDIGDAFARVMSEEEMRNLIYHLWCGLTDSNDRWAEQIKNLKDGNYDIVAECPTGHILSRFREGALKLADELKTRIEVDDDVVIIKNVPKNKFGKVRDYFRKNTQGNEIELYQDSKLVEVIQM